jgi:membrane protease YdiL (CAAX protease family)
VGSFWRRLPVVVQAIVAGGVVLYAGEIPWVGIPGHRFLAGWNLRAFVVVPWAVIPMAAYLWLFWKYVGGSGWPSTTAASRRRSLRANSLSGDVWGMSLFAGLIGLTATLPLLSIMGRLVRLPAESEPIALPSGMPFVTAFVLLVMASVVAGVVEEAAFRGYMQGPIERRHGLLTAITITGIVFGLAHYSHHPASALAMLPYYVAISAVYGGLAYATNSILPGLALHAGGDVFSFTRLWATGQPEWQVSAVPAGLIWDTGVDIAFVRSVVVFALLAGGAVWAYVATTRAARGADVPSGA